MKKLLGVLSFLVLTACTEHNVGVVGNKRMQISGNIVDTGNRPLENIHIIASGSENSILDARPEELLGEGFANAAGEFSFVSLDTDNSFYGISINHPDHEKYNEAYATVHFLDSIGSRGNAFKFVDVELYKTQRFELKIENTTANNDTLFYEVSFPITENYQGFNGNSLDENSFLFRSEIEIRNRMLPGEEEIILERKTLENSTIQFKYKFSAQAVYDTINVEITPENPVYEFSY